jgi:protein CWC15
MTTAHRPTWKAAVGRAQEGGGWSAGGALSTQSSARDLASHTKLKFRTGAQLASVPSGAAAAAGGGRRKTNAIIEASLLKIKEAEENAELGAKRAVRLDRERLLRENEQGNEEKGRLKLLTQTADVDEEKIRAKYDDEDDDDEGKGGSGRWSDLDDDGGGGLNNLQSDESDLDASDHDNDSDDDDSEDEDEEAALQAELAKIRQERAAAKAKEEAEAMALEQAQMEEAALTGNPLLNSSASSSSGRLKRRWNDDVVFRNQARSEPDQNKKRFINDTVRNDFHKRFLNKFIR